MATLQWLEPYRSYCDSPALPTVTAPRIDSQAEPSLLDKADVPCGRKLGLEQTPSAQRTALDLCALY